MNDTGRFQWILLRAIHHGLSGSYLVILMLGMSFIMTCALYVKNIVFILGNGPSLTLIGLLVVLWFRYRRQ